MRLLKKFINWLFGGTSAIAGDDVSVVRSFSGIQCELSYERFGECWVVTVDILGRDGTSHLRSERVFQSMADAIKFIDEFNSETGYYRLLAGEVQRGLDSGRMKQFFPNLTHGRRSIIIRGAQGSGKTTLANAIIRANGKFPVFTNLSWTFWPEDTGADNAVLLVDDPVPTEQKLTRLKHLLRAHNLEINIKSVARKVVDRPPVVVCVGEHFPVPERGDFKVIDLGDSRL